MPRFDINDAVEMSKLVVTPLFKGVRMHGSMEGKIWIADDFDGPLPDDIQAAFEGK